MTRILALRTPVAARALRRRALHQALRAAAEALGRLVPARALCRDAELAPEWFKYPPI